MNVCMSCRDVQRFICSQSTNHWPLDHSPSLRTFSSGFPLWARWITSGLPVASGRRALSLGFNAVGWQAPFKQLEVSKSSGFSRMHSRTPQFLDALQSICMAPRLYIWTCCVTEKKATGKTRPPWRRDPFFRRRDLVLTGVTCPLQISGTFSIFHLFFLMLSWSGVTIHV